MLCLQWCLSNYSTINRLVAQLCIGDCFLLYLLCSYCSVVELLCDDCLILDLIVGDCLGVKFGVIYRLVGYFLLGYILISNLWSWNGSIGKFACRDVLVSNLLGLDGSIRQLICAYRTFCQLLGRNITVTNFVFRDGLVIDVVCFHHRHQTTYFCIFSKCRHI